MFISTSTSRAFGLLSSVLPLAAFLLGWYVVGGLLNRRRYILLARQVRDSIQAFGGTASIRQIGRNAFRIEVEKLPAPFEKLSISALLFALGMAGVLLRRNALVVFMSIELMLNAVNLTFVAFARQMAAMTGQVAVFFVIVVAAGEVVVGLSIIITIFRTRDTVDIDDVDLLRG